MATAAKCKRAVRVGVPISASHMETYAASGRKTPSGMAGFFRTMALVDQSILRDNERIAKTLPGLEAERDKLMINLNANEARLDTLLEREVILTQRLKSPDPRSERTQQMRRRELRIIREAYEKEEASLEDLKGTLECLAARIRRARTAKREVERHSLLTSDTSSDELIS